jgi:hypothetical protein
VFKFMGLFERTNNTPFPIYFYFYTVYFLTCSSFVMQVPLLR